MARTRSKRWSYSAGERGRNRVRAFEHPSGVLMVEFSDGGKRTRLSLGHKDRKRAKQEADLAAAKLARAERLRPADPRSVTLGELFDMYGCEVTPKNGERHQRYDRRASAMLLRYFGAERKADSLSLQDWERFGRDRASGRIGQGLGPWRPVRSRTVQKDLSFLRSVLNWATVAGDGRGGVFLQTNPLKGFKLPKEKNPLRVVLNVT